MPKYSKNSGKHRRDIRKLASLSFRVQAIQHLLPAGQGLTHVTGVHITGVHLTDIHLFTGMPISQARTFSHYCARAIVGQATRAKTVLYEKSVCKEWSRVNPKQTTLSILYCTGLKT
jgi:hypothetical protein